MNRDIERFSRVAYDLLVVGGGINGASIAHLAAKNGIRTALLEKGDFASGTSSKSTKLIHGGLRYLENLEVDLVYESLKERKIQLAAAPHLVKPLAFIIPVYENDKRPLWMMWCGVFLYDLLAGPYKIGAHKLLSKEEVLRQEPGLKTEGLTGGVLYYDAQMDDARLCLENVLAADKAGAHVANYVKVTDFIKENGRVAGVRARDLPGKKDLHVWAKRVIVAGGPWTNELLRLDQAKAPQKVRTTKGIHIVYKDKLSDHALFIPSESDRRIFFVIPWLGHSLIGTTDTDYDGDTDDVKVEKEDVDYLLRETKRVLPKLEIAQDKILSTFAGLRPLVRQGGSASKVSRKHLFYESRSGLIFVVGGKYTTYRKVAVDCLKRIFLGFRTNDPFTVYGSGEVREPAAAAARQYGLEPAVVQSLMDTYGSRYKDVLKLTEKDPSLKEKICEAPPVIKAQIVYSVQVEMARTPEDVLHRRLPLGYLGGIPASCVDPIQAVFRQAA
jgi:glycerol-3-phosphate dehydrogenase